MGFLYFWNNDKVDLLTATYIITTIGVGVDYPAHITLAYMASKGAVKLVTLCSSCPIAEV